jgi:hypothetical protein
MKFKPARKARQVFKPTLAARPVRALPLSLWLVSAVVGESTNVELTVPALDIMEAGLRSDRLIAAVAFKKDEPRRDFQTVAITQLVK